MRVNLFLLIKERISNGGSICNRIIRKVIRQRLGISIGGFSLLAVLGLKKGWVLDFLGFLSFIFCNF